MVIDAPLEPGHSFVSGDTLTVALLNKAFELSKAKVPTPVGLSSGGVGATDAVGAQLNLATIGILNAWVYYTNDGVSRTIGTLPADSYVFDVEIHVTEAFDDTGTDVIEVGWDADNNALSVSQTVELAGVFTPTAGANRGYNSASQTVKAYYNGSNSDAAAGKALVVVRYAQVTAP